jgi:N4-gp56 family major capsid protein
MAGTDYPLNSPLAVKTWSSDLMKEALKRTIMLPLIGKDSNSCIQVKTEVNKSAGDRIRFGIRQQLSGGGISGDGVLEGNEEALETYTQDIIIDQLRHAVRSSGKMSEQRVPFSVRAEARDGLADWWADRIDTWAINQLTGLSTQSDVRYTGMQVALAPDADHIVYAGSQGAAATAESSLSNSTTMKMSLTLLDYAVEKSKLAKNAMRPIMVDGESYLVALLHPYQVTDLRVSTNTGQWLDIQKAAMAGGKVDKSPIFTGALGVYNGVVLRESVRVPDPGTGPTGVRRAVLIGAQAASMAFGRGYGKGTYSWQEELFDYENQLGVAAGCIGGLQKNRFNGSDFATIVISTSALAH